MQIKNYPLLNIQRDHWGFSLDVLIFISTPSEFYLYKLYVKNSKIKDKGRFLLVEKRKIIIFAVSIKRKKGQENERTIANLSYYCYLDSRLCATLRH